MNEETIDIIVEEMSKQLSETHQKKFIRNDDEPIWGWELLLCNIEEIKGKRVIKDKIYNIPVPVYSIPDHRKKLRMAFLARGHAGVTGYLEQYFKPDQMVEFRAIIFGKHNEYQMQRFRDAGIEEDLIQKLSA